AEAEDRPIDYGQAMDLLGKVLAKNPDDPVALFNRAMVAEYLFLYTQAVADWEHYLQIDPTSGWAQEARQHLRRVRDELQKHEQGLHEPLGDPRTFADNLSNGDPQATTAIDRRVEDYLQIAITQWLPDHY